LHCRGKVAQHDKIDLLIGCGEYRIKISQYVEIGDERVARIEVVMIPAGPEK